MKILPYSEKHLEFRDRLRQFLKKEILPYVDQWEKDHIVPKDVWRKMGENGFLCTATSPKYGGMGGDFLYSVIVNHEICKTNQLGLSSQLHSDIVVPYIETFGTEEQKSTYLPKCVSGEIITALAMTEPDAGSDLAAMTTTAIEEGDKVVINGSKTFISNAINSGLIVLAAKDPAVENVHRSISLYLVESGTPGLKKGPAFEKMGQYSQDTAELFFNNCKIPKRNRLGEKGAGFIMLMQKLQQERLICALMGIASSELVLEWLTKYCRTTKIAGHPLANQQAVQFELVEMATDLTIARTFVEKLVADHMEKKEVVVETSMAKYWVSDMVKRTTARAIDLAGDIAIHEKCPIARTFRDVQVLSIYAGTNEIMKGIIAKKLLLSDAKR